MNTPVFAAHPRKEEEYLRSLSMERADLFAKKTLNKYAAVRALAADSIVATGVAPFPLPQRALCREDPRLAETVVDDPRQ